VLAIGASGDNALAFLTAGARSVTAIDFNPTQNHLLELKLSAIETLEPADVHAFLGVTPSSSRDFFYRTARPRLSEPARAYWDAHPELLERGVIHVGRFENYFKIFRTAVLPLIHRRRTIERLFELETLAEQREFYDRTWDKRRWRFLFRIFFGKTLLGRLGRDPAFFKYVQVDQVGENFRKRAEHALTEIPIKDNWFLEYIVRGGYGRPDLRLPPYLRAEHHALLREHGRDRLRLAVGSFETFLPEQEDNSFDCFYLSDIFEWMSEDAFAELLRRFHRVGRPGGRLTYRNLLVHREHPAAVDDLLEHDAELSRKLHFQDRSFVYGNFVVERIKKTT
jgi:S-adenosylmethionine-diacylglycerol 3-amino-3-carboxypropyl transferase